MDAVTKPGLPGAVVEVVRRFESWRRTRLRRGPVPEGLWREAVQLARGHGVHPIARALRLDYYALKRRLDSSQPRSGHRPAFVEVSVCPSPVTSGCVVEMERPDGARMRVRLSRPEDLVAVTESFWRCRA